VRAAVCRQRRSSCRCVFCGCRAMSHCCRGEAPATLIRCLALSRSHSVSQTIDGADHFLAGHWEDVASRVMAWIQRQADAAPRGTATA
jgi:hypothetical protein